MPYLEKKLPRAFFGSSRVGGGGEAPIVKVIEVRKRNIDISTIFL